LSRNEKIVILSFDETYVSHKMCYDKGNEQILGPHKCVQVVMARGEYLLFILSLNMNDIYCV